MANKAMHPNQLSGSKKQEEKMTIMKRVGWVVLVGVVPILATILLVGVALQIVGFPVWRTTLNLIGVGNHQTQFSTPLQTAKKDLATATAKERLDSGQIAVLRQQVLADQRQIATLMTQINKLESKQSTDAIVQNGAKQEAEVLVQMDPGQAANLLAQMQPNDAAATVATMSSADSGAILGEMNPANASKILAMAAKLKSASVAAQTGQPDNATSGG